MNPFGHPLTAGNKTRAGHPGTFQLHVMQRLYSKKEPGAKEKAQKLTVSEP
jgi:hypothetical protein